MDKQHWHGRVSPIKKQVDALVKELAAAAPGNEELGGSRLQAITRLAVHIGALLDGMQWAIDGELDEELLTQYAEGYGID